MASETHLAEKTLQALRKRRSTPACYPCFKRKVKCRGGRPCEACTVRNHPEICCVEEMSKGSRRHPKGKTQKLSVAQNYQLFEPASSEPSMGDMSTIKFIKNSLSAPEGQNDTLMAMGIGSPGFAVSLSTLSGNTYDQKELAPSRAEILQYYAPFRDLVMPLYPIVPDPLSFENLVQELLQGSNTVSKPADLAVVLSCLALGAQFTEAQIEKRWEISQDFIVRANTYLQKANSIFEPSTEVIQTLLMIGIGLQNLGLSNGAWNLLGLTYRCAQSLGLHKCTDSNEPGRQGAMLWVAIIWQDALMSLRYDRTPLTPKEEGNDSASYMGPVLQPYHDMISKFCWVSIMMLHQPPTCRRDPRYASSKVDYVEHLVVTAQEHLSPLCTTRTLQQKFQYHAIRLHSSLLIVELCRPVLSISEADTNQAQKAVRQKGVHYLFVVVESFLELCTLSNIPFRSWSFMQAAVSCALVLALIDSKHPLPQAKELLRRMVDAFRVEDIPGTSRPRSDLQQPEVYGICSRSAKLLESILDRTSSVPAQAIHSSATSAALDDSLQDVTSDEGFSGTTVDEYLNWPVEMSLFDSTFSDALLQANMYGSTYGT